MSKLDVPPTHRDLLDSSTAVLATVGKDGRPQLSAVWFLAEDGEVRVSLNTSRQKVANLRANPAITLFILDLASPTRYLEIRGDPKLSDDPDYEFAGRVGKKYGADLRSFDGDNPHRLVVDIDVARLNAVDIMAGS